MTSKQPLAQPLPVPIDFYLFISACVALMFAAVMGNSYMRSGIKFLGNVGSAGGDFDFVSPVGDAATLESLAFDYEPVFGQSFGPETGNQRSYGPHGGVDFDCSAFGMASGECAGLPVYAMLGGEVVETTAIASSSNGASYRLTILAEDWEGPIEHRYVHVDSLTVKVGDIVTTGQQIAAIAPTDSTSTGVLLDLKVWRVAKQSFVNPQTYLAEAIEQRKATNDLVELSGDSSLSDEEIKRSIGAAEGTVDWDTLEPDADYDGHSDPCILNGTCPGRGTNKGFFSYDYGSTPAEANAAQLKRLRQAEQTIQNQAISKFGQPLSKAALAVVLDNWNQSPLAGEDTVAHLSSANPTVQQLVDARVESYYEDDGTLNAPGLGNTRINVIEDQRRRVGAVIHALEKLN